MTEFQQRADRLGQQVHQGAAGVIAFAQRAAQLSKDAISAERHYLIELGAGREEAVDVVPAHLRDRPLLRPHADAAREAWLLARTAQRTAVRQQRDVLDVERDRLTTRMGATARDLRRLPNDGQPIRVTERDHLQSRMSMMRAQLRAVELRRDFLDQEVQFLQFDIKIPHTFLPTVEAYSARSELLRVRYTARRHFTTQILAATSEANRRLLVSRQHYDALLFAEINSETSSFAQLQQDLALAHYRLGLLQDRLYRRDEAARTAAPPRRGVVPRLLGLGARASRSEESGAAGQSAPQRIPGGAPRMGRSRAQVDLRASDWMSIPQEARSAPHDPSIPQARSAPHERYPAGTWLRRIARSISRPVTFRRGGGSDGSGSQPSSDPLASARTMDSHRSVDSQPGAGQPLGEGTEPSTAGPEASSGSVAFVDSGRLTPISEAESANVPASEAQEALNRLMAEPGYVTDP
ncbi:MAG: hypothetical protein ACRC0L_09080, partial [Angustibacter sp.]